MDGESKQESQRVAAKVSKVPEEKMVRIAYKPTVVTGSFLAEEVWDKINPPKYLVFNFGDKTTHETDMIDLGETETFKEDGEYFERKVVYKPLDNDMLRKGLVIVPRKATPCELKEVLKEADDFVNLCYDAREQIAPVKIFVREAVGSWFLDRFTDDPKLRVAGAGKFAPIIAIRGTSGSGKNRLLYALRLLSYRPYYQLCTSRVPSLFRPIDMWEGTLCLDEADFLYSNMTSEVSHFLNSRCYGTPISRQNSKNPKITDTFTNFGLTELTQRGGLGDDATSTRSLPYWSLRTKKRLPTVETKEMLERGLDLQDKLLYLRFKYYREFRINPSAWVEGIRDHRLNAAMLPLIALSKIEPSILEDINETVKQFADIRVREKSLTPDGLLVAHLWDLVNQEPPFIDIWNNNLYFTTEIEKKTTEVDERGFKQTGTETLVVPLTTTILQYELGVSAKEARETARRLNLINPGKEKYLKAIIRVGGKTYKPIFFEPERFEMALTDFIVGYQDGELSKKLHYQETLLKEDNKDNQAPTPTTTLLSKDVTDVTLLHGEKSEESAKKVTDVTDVTLLHGEKSEESAKKVTDVTDVTLPSAQAHLENSPPRASCTVTSVTSVTYAESEDTTPSLIHSCGTAIIQPPEDTEDDIVTQVCPGCHENVQLRKAFPSGWRFLKDGRISDRRNGN